MSEIESESEKFLDVLFYRDAVLEIIVKGKYITREVYQLRLTLFVHAAGYYFSHREQEVLEPFPSCFFDATTKSRRYDVLKKCLSAIPNLEEINNRSSLPALTWQLLHWLFTNPLEIKAEKESETSEYFTDELRTKTGLARIPYPSSQCIRFEITHPSDINSTKQFLKHKSEFGSFYGYHGSPANNFHSIIHRGLRCSLNKVGMYGPGTYLSSSLETARNYSLKHFYGSDSLVVNHTFKNRAAIKFCVAIVETIKHPSINVVNLNKEVANGVIDKKFQATNNNILYFVVNSDDFMRLKYLLVFY